MAVVIRPSFFLYKQIANFIYRGVKNLDLIETAREINSGVEIELRETELKEIRDLIVNKSTFPAFIKLAVSEFIAEALKQHDDKQKKDNTDSKKG